MNLGFQDCFVEYVKDRSKPHSIRAGDRWKVGDRADLFAESRRRKVFELRPSGDGTLQMVQTAGMRLLFRSIVVRVDPITVWLRPRPQARLHADEQVFAGALGIAIADTVLSDDEANRLAYIDGFRSMPLVPGGPLNALAEMAQFWLPTHRIDRKPFHGQIVHWDPDERFMDKAETCFRRTKALAYRFHKNEPPPCPCGKPMRHRGSCAYRMQYGRTVRERLAPGKHFPPLSRGEAEKAAHGDEPPSASSPTNS